MKAVVALHNFVMAIRQVEDSYSYCPSNYVDQDTGGGVKAGQLRDILENGGMLPIRQ